MVEYLKELAEKEKVDLDILTMITDEDLVHLYNTAKLVVYAPYLEPFGYVPLEAMACATPVVGVKEGGIRETVLHNKTGLLTQRDTSDFARAIITLSEDKQMWEKFSINSLKYTQSFWTLEDAGKRLTTNIKRILEKEEVK